MNLKKWMAALLASSMALANTAVMANAQEVRVESLKFYQLTEDGGKIATEYRDIGTDIVRYQKETTALTTGTIRVVAEVANDADVEKDVTLFAALKTDDGVVKTLAGGETYTLDQAESKKLTADITVEAGKNYTLETFLWDSAAGMTPLENKTVLSPGPTDLAFSFAEPYDGSNPSIILTWNGNGDIASYDVYAEGVFMGNTDQTTYTLDLEPYTPYRISVVGKRADGTLTARSNEIYMMTEDTVESQRQRMSQWEDDRFGMFIHWGGYAAFAGKFQGINTEGQEADYDCAGGQNGSYAEWIKFGAHIPDDTYKAYVEEHFTAENYDPAEWVRIAKDAGMKYIILTSKHHEGLALFNTAVENGWSAEDTAAKARISMLEEQDMLKQLIKEAAKEGIRVGVYYSQAIDWAQSGSMGWQPQRVARWSQEERDALKQELINAGFTAERADECIYSLMGNCGYDLSEKMIDEVIVPQVEELMNLRVEVDGKEYGIDTLWWDMGQKNYPEFNYKIMKKVVELDPEKKIINNNRILHSGQYTTMPFDFVTPEQSIPSAPEFPYWETCMTMNNNWGYAESDHDFKPSEDLITKLVHIASMGGNFLLNVGPKADGTFPDESVQLLSAVGDWMQANGESIYATSANPFTGDFSWGTATTKENKIYLHISQWDGMGQLFVPGLETEPVSARLITGPDTSAPLDIAPSERYGGYVLSGEALKGAAPYAASSVVVLEFEDENFVAGDNSAKLPVNQNSQTGYVTLRPQQANIVIGGDGYTDYLRVENNSNLGWWNHKEDYAVWTINITKPGTYALNIDTASQGSGNLYGQLKRDGILVDTAGAPFASTGDWINYETVQLGSLTFDEIGEYTFELHRDGGAVNIKNTEWTPISEYEFDTVVQNADTITLNAGQALRSYATNAAGQTPVYGLDAANGRMTWKIELNEGVPFAVQLSAASANAPATVNVSIKDLALNTLSTVSATLTSGDWNLIDLTFADTLDAEKLEPGSYYIELNAVGGGKINVEKITLRNANRMILNQNCISFTSNANDATITSNVPITLTSNDENIAYVQQLSETEYTVFRAPGAKHESYTTLTAQSTDETVTIPVAVIDGKLNTAVTSAAQAPAQYARLASTGDAAIAQDITESIKAQGAGLYKISMLYQTPAVNAAPDVSLGTDGRWTVVTPQNQTAAWMELTAYTEILPNADVENIVFKPVDNLNSFNGAAPINLAQVSLRKIGGAEAIINGGFAQGAANWNLTKDTDIAVVDTDKKVLLQNPLDSHIRLRANEAAINNVDSKPSGGDTHDIVLAEDNEMGRLDEWWDKEDTVSWNIKIDKGCNYIIYGSYSNRWNTGLDVIITGDNGYSQTVHRDIAENKTADGTDTEFKYAPDVPLGMLALPEAGEYTVTAKLTGAVLQLNCLNFVAADQADWTTSEQQANGFDLTPDGTMLFGKSLRNIGWCVADWYLNSDYMVWKINCTEPKDFRLKLRGGNGGQENLLYVVVKDSAGREVYRTEDFALPAIDSWANVTTDVLTTIDLSEEPAGIYYVELHQLGAKGMNVQNFIME